MTRILAAMVLVLFCIAGDTAGQNREGKASVKEVLFDQPIGKAGQRLVVTKGPNRDPSSFEGLRRTPLPGQGENHYYEVRAELVSPKRDTVLLAARLRVEDGTKPDKGSVVLNAMTEPGNIVLAMAEGADLFLWQIGIARGSTCWTQLRVDKGWERSAAPYVIDNTRVGVTLTRMDDGRLYVTVVEKSSKGDHHTLYEEAEKDSLRFKWVRDWPEKAAGK
jgi:hypothetical protein